MSSESPDPSRNTILADFLSPPDSEYIVSQSEPGSGSTVDNNEYSQSYTVDEPVSVEDLKVHDIIHEIIPKSLKNYFDACKTNLDEVVPATLKSWIEYKSDGIKTNAYNIQEDIISALSNDLTYDISISNETLNMWIRTEVEPKLLKLVDDTPGNTIYLKNIINDAKNGNTNNMDQFINTLGAIITCIIVDTIKDVTRSYVSTKKFSPEQLQQLFVHCNTMITTSYPRKTREIITSRNRDDPNELISLLWWMRCDTMHDNICDRHDLTCLKQKKINNMILDCVKKLEEHILEKHSSTESQFTKAVGTGNSAISEFIENMKRTNDNVEDKVLRSAITCMSRMNKGAMINNTDVPVPNKVKEISENKTINNAYGKQLRDDASYSGINITASQASALDAGVTERGAKEGFYFNANVLYNMGGGSLAVYQEYENDSDDDSIIYIKTTMTIMDSTGYIIGQGRKRISYLKKDGDEYKFTGEALTLNRAAYGGWQDCLDRYVSLNDTKSSRDYGNILVKFMLEKWIGDAYITLVLRLGQRGAGDIGKCIHINKLNTGGVNEALETEYAKQSGTMDDDSDTVTIKDIVLDTPAENIIELTNDRLAYGFFAYMSLLFPTDGIVGALLNSGQGHAMWYDNSSDYSDKKMYIDTPSKFFPHANIDDNANSNSSDSESERLFRPKYSVEVAESKNINDKRSLPRSPQGEVSASQEEHKQFQAKSNNDTNNEVEQAELDNAANNAFTDSESEDDSQMTKGGKRRKRHSYKAKRTRRVRKSKRKSKRTRRSRKSKRKSKRTRRVRKPSRRSKTRRRVK